MKALWEGALRQMSVSGGAERVKGGMVVVVVLSVMFEVEIELKMGCFRVMKVVGC